MKKKKPAEKPDGKNIRVIGYARVSTDDQVLDMQIDALKDYPCDQIFSEKRSARRKRRPQFEMAKKLLREGDTLVVWRLDRLSRDALEMLETVNWLTEQGVNLVSVTESLDTQTPMGRFAFGIMALVAQLESDTTSFRTTQGVRAAQARGVKFGRKPKITGALAKKVDADLKAGMSIRAISLKRKLAQLTISRYRAKKFPVKAAKKKRKT